MDSVSHGRFYVYVLKEPDGRVFYVGKGSSGRPYSHIDEARKGDCICRKCKVIQRIWKTKREVLVAYVFRSNNEQEVFRQESAYIQELGEIYHLTNRNGNPYYQDGPPPEIPYGLMMHDQLCLYLDRLDLTPKQRELRVVFWAKSRLEELEWEWRIARNRQDRNKEIMFEAEMEIVKPLTGRRMQQWLL